MPDPARTKFLFERAMSLSASDRETFVRGEAGDDKALAGEVLALLEHAVEGTTQTGPIRKPSSTDGRGSSLPDCIGNYRIRGVLGEGGFGVVYEAEQTAPVKRRVALKVIKPGMDSKAILARFEAERQALAIMDHPNIAKVFDGGVTDPEHGSRPYFVMEIVKGSPITEYSDRQRLTVEQRLTLLASVCDAIQHAHTKGIIHRDIKPSNVLVEINESDQPTAKVIDFGVAKAMHQPLTEQTIFTQQGQMIGTPEYMSPEQAEMHAEDIDTRSDVYSLGVLLYELLTGQRPFDLKKHALGEIQRIIRDEDPPRPSTRLSSLGDSATDIAQHRRTDSRALAGRLRKELEWIPLKALRKDRTERYGSAADLAEDIRRYLNGQALEAGPESSTYKARKFVRRNKGPVTAAAVVFVVLVLGVVGTSLGFAMAADRAEGERVAKEEAVEKQGLAEAAVEERDQALAAETVQREAAETAKDESEASSYTMSIRLAENHFDRNELNLAQQVLEQIDSDQGGWERGWLHAQADPSLIDLGEGFDSAAFSNDGVSIATGSRDGTVRVWDTESGAQLLEITGHNHQVISVSFSPDGSKILSSSMDETARVWDAGTGESLLILAGHSSGVLEAEFSRDGSRILTKDDRRAYLWDTNTGDLIVELAYRRSARGSYVFLDNVSLSSDKTRVFAMWADRKSQVWDATTGTVLYEVEPGMPGVAFAIGSNYRTVMNRHGERLVSLLGDSAKVLDFTTGEAIAELDGFVPDGTAAAFSPDGARLVTGSDNGLLCVWDTETGKNLTTFSGHTELVKSVSFSTDGERVLSVGGDSVRLWDIHGRSLLLHIDAGESVRSAELSRYGRKILTRSGNGRVRVWDAIPLVSATKHFRFADLEPEAVSPDGQRMVILGQMMTEVRDISTGACLLQLDDQTTGMVFDLAAFSPDGTRIATASAARFSKKHSGDVWIWDASTGEHLEVLSGHTEAVRSLSFSAMGTRLVSGSQDGSARVWDGSTGELVAVLGGNARNIQTARFNPDGSRIVTTTTFDTTAKIWDANSGELQRLLEGHTRGLSSAVYSPDGARIVTAAEDGTARVWEAVTGRCVAVLTGHVGTVRSVSFSPGGSQIVTASEDGTARVWEAVTGRCVAVLAGHVGTVRSASFSPDGTRIVTTSQDGTARVWDAIRGDLYVILEAQGERLRSGFFSHDGTRVFTGSFKSGVRVWDSVAYRDRFPEILKKREMTSRMQAVVTQRLNMDISLEKIREELLSVSDRSPSEQAGLQTAIMNEQSSALRHSDISANKMNRFVFEQHSSGRSLDDLEREILADNALSDDERDVALRAIVREQVDEASRRVEESRDAMHAIIEGGLNTGRSLAEIHETLLANPALSASERSMVNLAVDQWQRVLDQEEGFKEWRKVDSLNVRAWDAVRFLPVEPADAAMALRLARDLCQLKPDVGVYLNTLGVALHRATEFEEALKTLLRSDELNRTDVGEQPADVAFLAMTRWQLGQHEEARSGLARLHELAATEAWADDEETTRWLQEAESLITPVPQPTPDPVPTDGP